MVCLGFAIAFSAKWSAMLQPNPSQKGFQPKRRATDAIDSMLLDHHCRLRSVATPKEHLSVPAPSFLAKAKKEDTRLHF